jgi:hypothetical protein
MDFTFNPWVNSTVQDLALKLGTLVCSTSIGGAL